MRELLKKVRNFRWCLKKGVWSGQSPQSLNSYSEFVENVNQSIVKTNMSFKFIKTRTLACYARLILAPVGGWGTVQTFLGANKYSCILIPTLSYPYIPIITYNRSCYSSIWCYKFAKYTQNICSSTQLKFRISARQLFKWLRYGH